MTSVNANQDDLQILRGTFTPGTGVDGLASPAPTSVLVRIGRAGHPAVFEQTVTPTATSTGVAWAVAWAPPGGGRWIVRAVAFFGTQKVKAEVLELNVAGELVTEPLEEG